jgi:hypothetical protein
MDKASGKSLFMRLKHALPLEIAGPDAVRA